MSDIETLQAEALARGYKDETCPKCGAIFKAHIHFVRCEAKPCPMASTTETRTLAQLIADGLAAEGKRF